MPGRNLPLITRSASQSSVDVMGCRRVCTHDKPMLLSLACVKKDERDIHSEQNSKDTCQVNSRAEDSSWWPPWKYPTLDPAPFILVLCGSYISLFPFPLQLFYSPSHIITVPYIVSETLPLQNTSSRSLSTPLSITMAGCECCKNCGQGCGSDCKCSECKVRAVVVSSDHTSMTKPWFSTKDLV
jgi:hypothetical protein